MKIHVEVPDSFAQNIKALEKELSITSGFFQKLLEEDDWSFVIKLHSLFEAAISYLLIKDLGKEELQEIISALELSNVQTGKLAFARSLQLLDKEELRYIRALSELRNKLVHNISNVNFDFEQYVKELDKNQFNNFVQSFAFNTRPEFEISGKKISRSQFTKENPKFTIWLNALNCLDWIYLKKEHARLRTQLNDEMLQFAKSISSKQSK